MPSITCPYCGTSYTAFQPNCSNCGATLPLPEEVARAEKKKELVFPPSPPRDINPNYVWRLLTKDPWAISALIFALLGSIFSVVGAGLTIGIITAFVGLPFLGMGLLFLGGGAALAYWRYQQADKQVQLLKEGLAIEGKIVDLEANYNVRINGRTPWKVYYQFELDGATHEGMVSTLNQPGPTLQSDSPAVVLYLPDNPTINSIYPHP